MTTATATATVTAMTTTTARMMTEAMSRPVAVESGKFDMSRYIGDREMFDGDDVGQKMMVEQQRRSNFRFRTFPTQIAVFLGVAAWWIVLQSWFVQLDDLKRSGVADAYDRVHRWIMWSVFTTLVFGLLGLLVTVRYQICLLYTSPSPRDRG